MKKQNTIFRVFFPLFICGVLTLASCVSSEVAQSSETEASSETQLKSINGVEFELAGDTPFFTWADLPSDVDYERQEIQEYTNAKGDTHFYEAVYVASGNLNWFQSAYLAEDAGGYLASITDEDENSFVFSLVSDEKYFYFFPPHDGDPDKANHYEIGIGPLLGGYQPLGSVEPAGSWIWLSGETWEYINWAVNLNDGVTDKDPRDNTQPNDSGTSIYGQRIMGFGEMNTPVSTWGDYGEEHGSYGLPLDRGIKSYGFVIEYPSDPRN